MSGVYHETRYMTYGLLLFATCVCLDVVQEASVQNINRGCKYPLSFNIHVFIIAVNVFLVYKSQLYYLMF